jgi:hypothetical protein
MKSAIKLAALSVVFVLAASGLSYAQNAALTPFDKLPDWFGTWTMMGGTIFDAATQTGKGGSVTPGVREHPPYNDVYEKKYQASLALRDVYKLPDTQNFCGIPVNYPRILNLPDDYEFVIRPDEFYIIAENGENAMRVYTDGRTLPKLEDTWGTYTGTSVGHWEGDTLVFQTIALKGDRDNDSILDRTGLVLSDAARVTTRARKTNDNTLQFVMTIEDPKALTKPWVVTKQFKKQMPGLYLYDYGCAENNRNPVNKATGEVSTLGPDGKPIE